MPQGNKVVLDTNIIISAAISTDGTPAKIFERFLSGELINYTSEEIISEIEDVMNRPFFKERIDDDFKEFLLKNFKEISIIVEPKFDEDISRTVTLRTRIGSIVNSIDRSKIIMESENISGADRKSKLIDADIAELFSDISRHENVLQTSYKASQAMLNQNLLDFLR